MLYKNNYNINYVKLVDKPLLCVTRLAFSITLITETHIPSKVLKGKTVKL